MKHKSAFILLLALLCSLTVTASPFESGKKYRIVSNDRSEGAIGLGANHGSNIQVLYVSDNELSDDCWWYITDTSLGKVTIQNALTGQYLAYTTSQKEGYYAFLTLSDQAGATDWKVLKSAVKNFVFSVNADVTRYIRVGPLKEGEFANMVKVLNYNDIYTYFNIYDEDGNKLNANLLDDASHTGVDAEPEPTIATDLDEYLSDLKLNGKEVAYAANLGTWLTVKPEGNASFTFTAKREGIAVKLSDDIAGPGSTELLICDNAGNTLKKSTITFTTMPVLDLRHGGSLTTNMAEYVWGHIHLTSAEEPQTVVLSAKYKTRGATASTWAKKAVNVKLRDFYTGEEKDSTLLGLRSASSWILDAMAIDRIKMRNRVCFDLWNKFSKLPYETNFDSRNGTVGRFVEVILNGQYAGIYCLTDRINRKLLDLKKPKLNGTELEAVRGVLYKSGSWDYTGLVPSQRGDWERLMKGDTRDTELWCNWELTEPEDYPCPEAWEPMVQLYENSTDNDYIKQHFYLSNVADFHLFALNFCLADNGNKNEFLSIRNITKATATEPDEYDKSRFVFTPWDLDTSLGGRYDGEVYWDGTYNSSKISDYRISQNAPFKNMLRDSEYMDYMRARWIEARRGVFSRSNVSATLENYANEFISSGAYARERQAWPRYNQLVPDLMKEVKYIEQWYADHMMKMDEFLGVESGITNTQPAIQNTELYYDLSGRCLGAEKPSQPGLYIKNSKKIIIK